MGKDTPYMIGVAIGLIIWGATVGFRAYATVHFIIKFW